MNDKNANVRRQDSAHRRGLVLGLTMAEIMVLILFILLLIFASALEKKEKQIVLLGALDQQLGDILRNNADGVTVKDIIQRIEHQQARIAVLQGAVDRLKSYEEYGEALESIVREIHRGGDKDATSKEVIDKLKQVAQLAKENENLKGQNTQLSRQIKASGKGNEFPSCWVTPDGKPESIFELLITEDGVQIKDRPLPHRTESKASLPLPTISYNTRLPLEKFQVLFRPLYQWSVAHDCRFYIIIASSDARAPILLVNAVNGYFYPDGKIQYRPSGL